jgi:hypothetical protein
VALNSDGVMLLAPGMVWGTLREQPVACEFIQIYGLGESIPPPASDSIPPPAPRAVDNAFGQTQCAGHETRVPTSHEWCELKCWYIYI